MNDEFEALPFAAAEMAMEDEGASADEWPGEYEDEEEAEEERGGRGGGSRGGGRGGMGRGGSRPVYRAGSKPGRGPMARPGRPGRPSRPGGKPKPGPRPRPWPGRWPAGPYWGPFYGGGAGGVMVSEPMGYPLPSQDAPPDDAQEPPAAFEPIDLPAADGGNGGGDGDAPQEEMPGTLRKVLASLAEAAPQFRHVGRLNEVKRLNLPAGPGFYLITFRKGNAWRAYNGQTGNLRQRLRQHLLGATVLGFDVPAHHVYIAESARPERARQNIEHAINRAMRQHHGGVLTNQVDELEMENLGWH